MMTNNRPEFYPGRHGGVCARRRSVLDLPDLLAGADRSTSSPTPARRSRSSRRCSSTVFNEARKDLPEIEHVIVIDGDGGDHTLDEVEEMDPDFDLDSRSRQVEPDDLLTLIYTSGTTGPPKGVQLSHRNLMNLVAGVDGMIDFPDRGAQGDLVAADRPHRRPRRELLPADRCSARRSRSAPTRARSSTSCRRCDPTFFFAVPRIWEKLKAGLEAKLAAIPGEEGEQARAGPRGRDPEGAARAGRRGGPRGARRGASPRRTRRCSRSCARRSASTRRVASTSAPHRPRSRCSSSSTRSGSRSASSGGCRRPAASSTINPPERSSSAPSGRRSPAWEVKLAEDGEVLVKGDANMVGYRNQPEKTAETIDADGWLSPATSASSTRTAT